MNEDELFEQLANDPDIASAVEHYNQTCDSQDAEDGCPVCVALKALEILAITSEDYKGPGFVKKTSNPAAILAIMARLSIWFSEAQADFLEFIAENEDHDHGDEEDEEDEDE